MPSAILCCVQQSIKIDPTSLRKSTLKSTPQLALILDLTWHHFGRVFGAMLVQVGAKSLSKSIQNISKKTMTFWMALGIDFDRSWLQLGGSSKGPVGLRWVSGGGLVGHFSALGAVLEPRWPQDLSKTPPRGLLGSIFKRFWLPTSWIFEWILDSIWLIFGWVGWLLASLLACLPACLIGCR